MFRFLAPREAGTSIIPLPPSRHPVQLPRAKPTVSVVTLANTRHKCYPEDAQPAYVVALGTPQCNAMPAGSRDARRPFRREDLPHQDGPAADGRASKISRRISGELNSVSVQGRSAITQALSSYNSGGYDVRIQIRPRQLRRRGMAPSPYQTLYLNPEDQVEALAEEKAAAAREQKLLQEAQARGETTVRIGQEHVCPTYVLTGLEQTQDAPGLQVPLGETASAGHRARRMDLEQALRDVGYDLDMERERRRAMDAIPIAWSQDAKHVLIGDGNLGAFGQNGYLSRSTASIGLPEIQLTQLLDLLPLLCKFFPRADTFVLVGGAADWLKMPAANSSSTTAQIVHDSLELWTQLWARLVNVAPPEGVHVAVMLSPQTSADQQARRIGDFAIHCRQMVEDLQHRRLLPLQNGVALLASEDSWEVPGVMDEETLIPSQIPHFVVTIQEAIRCRWAEEIILIRCTNAAISLRLHANTVYEGFQKNDSAAATHTEAVAMYGEEEESARQGIRPREWKAALDHVVPSSCMNLTKVCPDAVRYLQEYNRIRNDTERRDFSTPRALYAETPVMANLSHATWEFFDFIIGCMNSVRWKWISTASWTCRC